MIKLGVDQVIVFIRWRNVCGEIVGGNIAALADFHGIIGVFLLFFRFGAVEISGISSTLHSHAAKIT